jgi:GntR family transcriptional regulator
MELLELIAENPVPKQNVAKAVSERIRKLIVEGYVTPRAQLPPEVDLADAFGVSRNTLREALNILQQEGAVIRQHGVGTFVTEQLLLPNRLDLNIGVTELIVSLGREPGLLDLTVKRVPADECWAGYLDVPPKTELFEIRRVRSANDQPVVFHIDVLPESLLRSCRADVTEDKLTDLLRSEVSLYEMLEKHCGVHVDYGIATLKPVKADACLAQKLQVAAGALLMFISQIDYDSGGQPLLASREYHNADAYAFTVYRRR